VAEQILRPTSVPVSGRVTPASFPFYTTGEDALRMVSYNAAAGVRLKLNVRLLDASGKATPDSWDHIANTDRSAKTDDFPLSGQTLLNMTVFAAAGAPLMGQTFVIVQLIRGIGASAIVLGTILQGYVTVTQAQGWPGSPVQTSLESGGYYRRIIGTVPLAGVDLAEVCPTGARWELLEVFLSLQNSAAVANRIVALGLWRNNSMSFLQPCDTPATASQNSSYFASSAPKQPAVFDGFTHRNALPLPPTTILHAGDSFLTNTVGLQAGDQFNNPYYFVREWLEP
jgi:hypothetical protein